jgi:N-acetylglucosamine kinase-like BadF-type ATPase
MVLIADSGGTKTDWTLLVSPYPTRWDVVSTFQTQGINPIHQTPDTIRLILSQEMMGHLSSFSRAAIVNTGVLEKPLLSQVEVFFYGSGCTPVHVPMMKQLLSQLFQPEKVEVHSDLQAAARALCQHEPGIACILGTGANSGLYDGVRIVANTPPLGYILGDEGSGAVLGARFLNALYKGFMPQLLVAEFQRDMNLTMADAISRVYRQPMANRFLASLSPFIHRHLDMPEVRQLVVGCLRDFISRNVRQYQRPDLPVGFVGSIACAYEDCLREAAALEGFIVGRVMKSPMEGLIAYHRH